MFSNIKVNVGQLLDSSFQKMRNIHSLVFQFPTRTTLYDMSIVFIDKLICSPINSNRAIKLSLDKPLNHTISLKITRPAVLRQYFRKDSMSTPDNKKRIRRYNYGAGSETSSVGMNP